MTKTPKGMNITERFLNYTQYDTQSAEDSQTVPSTAKQLVFARYLKEELEREGLDDVEMDEKMLQKVTGGKDTCYAVDGCSWH